MIQLFYQISKDSGKISVCNAFKSTGDRALLTASGGGTDTNRKQFDEI